MDDKKQRRIANLRAWVERYGVPQKEKSYFSQLLGGNGSFGEKAARRLEGEYGMGAGYLDSEPTTAQKHGDGVVEPVVEYVGSARGATLLPVAGTAQLGVNGWYEEVQAVGADGYVECHSSDHDAYVLRVRGSSMHPAIRDRWFVVVEPNAALSAGEYVAIELKDGRKMVKEFLFRGAGAVTVESVNGGERMVLDMQDIAAIHAVGDIVPPSKHRNV